MSNTTPRPSVEPPLDYMIELVRRHGYHVVPREDVVTLEAENIVSLGELFKFGDDPGFGAHVVKNLHLGLAAHMQKLTTLETGNDVATNGKRFRVTAKLIAPGFGFSDPYEAELMRHMRGRGR